MGVCDVEGLAMVLSYKSNFGGGGIKQLSWEKQNINIGTIIKVI